MLPIAGYRYHLGVPVLPGSLEPARQQLPLARTPRSALTRATVAPVVRYLSDAQLRSLIKLARSRPDLVWPEGRDIAKARNAHFTNTATEMTSALAGEFDYLEGDVRVDNWSQPVMAHDRGARELMSLDEWLTIGAASGRGLKLDFKEAGAVIPALQACKRKGIPGSRLIINVSVYGDATSNITTAHLRDIRRMYPDAIINLGVQVHKLTPDVISRLQQWARAAGGQVMFPLRLDLIDRDVVNALRPYGKIAVWNNPQVFAPKNVLEETFRLRRLGVDGMIDLRKANFLDMIAGPLFDALVGVVGWGPAVGLVNTVGDLFRTLD